MSKSTEPIQLIRTAQAYSVSIRHGATYDAERLPDVLDGLLNRLDAAERKIDAHHNADLEENFAHYRCLICEHVEAST